MNTVNTTLQHKKVIIFFDSSHTGVNVPRLRDIEVYCLKHNLDVLNITYKNFGYAAIDYNFLLHKVKYYKSVENIAIVIGKDTYQMPENVISCAIFGALERLNIIDVYVCSYSTCANGKSNTIIINPYDEEKENNLLDRAISSLNHLTSNMNIER